MSYQEVESVTNIKYYIDNNNNEVAVFGLSSIYAYDIDFYNHIVGFILSTDLYINGSIFKDIFKNKDIIIYNIDSNNSNNSIVYNLILITLLTSINKNIKNDISTHHNYFIIEIVVLILINLFNNNTINIHNLHFKTIVINEKFKKYLKNKVEIIINFKSNIKNTINSDIYYNDINNEIKIKIKKFLILILDNLLLSYYDNNYELIITYYYLYIMFIFNENFNYNAPNNFDVFVSNINLLNDIINEYTQLSSNDIELYILIVNHIINKPKTNLILNIDNYINYEAIIII